MTRTGGDMEPAEETELVGNEQRTWTALIAALSRSQRLQLFVKLVLILGGGTMAGLAQLPLAWSEDFKARFGTTGIVFALIGGVLAIAMDSADIRLLADVRRGQQRWRALLQERDQAQALLQQGEELNQLYDRMIDVLERALALENLSLHERLDRFVRLAGGALVGPLDLGGRHEWTISVFLRETGPGGDRMVRRGSNWSDRDREGEDKRTWRYGKGWTGKAWQDREERCDRKTAVVEPDTSTDEARERYDTDGQGEESDYVRFLSVAAIPFHLGADTRVAGVVTVTSTREGSFSIVRGSTGRRNLEVMKSFARLTTALIGAGGT